MSKKPTSTDPRGPRPRVGRETQTTAGVADLHAQTIERMRLRRLEATAREALETAAADAVMADDGGPLSGGH